MDIQTMKLTFIEEFVKLQDESIIKKLAATLQRERQKVARPSISSFAGILSDEDAKTFMEASEECRKIDKDGW